MFASTIRAAVLAAIVAAGLATSAAAQQQPAPAPAPPAAPQLTPSHLAAAKQLAILMKAEEPIAAILDEMQLQVIRSFTTTRPEIANDLKQVLIAMNPDIAQRRDELLNAAARVFALRFTESEIAQLMQFLKTPLGEKYLQQQPLAFGEYMREVQGWISQLNDFVIEKVRVEMRKKGHEL